VVTVQEERFEPKRERRFRATQKRLLKRIATGAPLSEVLRDLILFVEGEQSGMLGSILLLDSETQTLHHGAAPSLPGDFREAINGLQIGPAAGSCGTAAHDDELVIAEDIRTDDRWDGYRDAARAHDLRACWSAPLHGEGEEILGTFALYYDEPRTPDASDRTLIEEASYLASIAIEHDRQKRELQIQKSQFRRLVENAQPIIFLLDADGILLVSEGDDLSALDVAPGEHVGESVFDLYADYPTMLGYIEKALAGTAVDDVIEMNGTTFDVWYAPYYDRSGASAWLPT
jgi:GAF domain-containing protein